MAVPFDTAPLDVYIDENGKLWRVVSICREPTVTLEEVEGTLYDPQSITSRAEVRKERKTGAINSFMFTKFHRIFAMSQQASTLPLKKGG